MDDSTRGFLFLSYRKHLCVSPDCIIMPWGHSMVLLRGHVFGRGISVCFVDGHGQDVACHKKELAKKRQKRYDDVIIVVCN